MNVGFEFEAVGRSRGGETQVLLPNFGRRLPQQTLPRLPSIHHAKQPARRLLGSRENRGSGCVNMNPDYHVPPFPGPYEAVGKPLVGDGLRAADLDWYRSRFDLE